MEFIPKNDILEFRPNTLVEVRKLYNLDKPGRMQDAINILNEWVQKQSHFKKKDFSSFYLETAIVACKGSIEKAKSQIDKICTMRTLLPQFFGDYNIKNDFGRLNEVAKVVMLPKLTEDFYRIYLCKFKGPPHDSSEFMSFYRANIILAEYLKIHDYLSGFMIIIDYSDVNLMDYVSKINPVELRQAMSIYIEGYGMKIKAIHIISPSKLIESLVTIMKQVLSPKVAGRINVHKSVEELRKVVPKSVLPKDYEGEEKSIQELQDQWLDILSSEENLNNLRDMNAAATDEAFRSTDTFSEQCAGMPGTFRLLSVD
uniref:CTD22 n=1 Tax=Heliconius melpomene TaxID=34740 RepID=A0A2H4RMP8_HELME|nr:CTD22 [Heliconius melpomene]